MPSTVIELAPVEAEASIDVTVAPLKSAVKPAAPVTATLDKLVMPAADVNVIFWSPDTFNAVTSTAAMFAIVEALVLPAKLMVV